MIDLPTPHPAPTAWLVLGLLLGIIISVITGEGLVEEVPLGTAGGLIGGTLYTLVGERQSGLFGASPERTMSDGSCPVA